MRELAAGILALNLLGWTGGVVTAHAARMPDLYTAEVAVAEGGLDAVFREALGAVIVRVSGSRAFDGPESVAAFGDPARLVQQYRATEPGIWEVGFDPVALRAGMDQAGLPVWGEERPATLVWLAIDSGRGQREILPAATRAQRSPDPLAAVRELLEQAARERGLPLLLPLVDSEDMATVSFPDLWGDFSDTVLDASWRYRADAVLIGRTRSVAASSSRVRWTLLFGGERFNWTGTLADGPEWAADLFAERLATPAGGGQVLRVEVREISGLDDYGQVYRYLSELGPVESCAVESATADRVLFRLQMRGDADQLLRLVALRRLLQPVDAPDTRADLQFVLLGPP